MNTPTSTPTSERPKFWFTPIASTAVFLSLGLLSSPTWALGLGKISIKSHIGEPLNAEVQVIALKPKELSTLRAKIADSSAFASTGMTYNRALNGARVTVENRGGSTYLKIQGYKPINEPFLDLVLNVKSDRGGLVRGYTVLVDPITKPKQITQVAPAPSYSAPAPAPVYTESAPTYVAPAPAPVVQSEPNYSSAGYTGLYNLDGTPANGSVRTVPSSAPTYTAPRPATTAPVYQPAPRQRAVRQTSRPARSYVGNRTLGENVKVRRGDTASGLAIRNARAAGVSLDQMLAAILQENQDAFINGNINRLKAGAVLRMPTSAEAQAVSRAEARQILASSKNFRSYRRKLAGSDAVQSTPAQKRASTGKVTSAVTDRSEAEAQDRLTLSKANAKGASQASTGEPSKEEAAAATSQKKEAETRVAELKKNIEELQKLTEKSSKATAAPTDTAEDLIPDVPGLKVPVTGETVKAEVENAVDAANEAATDAVETTAEVAEDLTDAVKTPAEEAVASAEETLKEASETVQDAIPELDTPPVKVVTPPQDTASTGIVDTIMDNIVPIGGGLAALLGLGGLLAFLRRRNAAKEEDAGFIESRIGPDSFFDASGGQSIDTASRPGGVISSSMVYSPSQLDAGGDVDPVAEADVYLAYNRDVQAEEILKEAMRITPSRVAIYTKLMEIYAQRGDVKAFDVVAREAHHLTGGQGEEWAKAAELGQKIDPQNPIYQQNDTPSPAASLDDNWEDKPAPFATATAPMAIEPDTSSSAPGELASASGSMDLDLGIDNLDASGSTPLEVSPDMAYTEASLSGGAPLTGQSDPAPLAAGGDADISFDLSSPTPLEPFSADATQPLATEAAAEQASAELALNDASSSFNNSGLSLDLGDTSGDSQLPSNAIEGDSALSLELPSIAPDAATSGLDFTDSDTLSSELNPDTTGDASYETKLMLAEEFKMLGDSDSARMMAQEVADAASGSIKDKAQAFIAGL